MRLITFRLTDEEIARLDDRVRSAGFKDRAAWLRYCIDHPRGSRHSMVESALETVSDLVKETPEPEVIHTHHWENKGYGVFCTECHAKRTLRP